MAQGSTERLPTLDRMARKLGLTRAADLLGTARKAAEAIDVNERSWRLWTGGYREISDGVLADVAAALEEHAAKCQAQAAALRELGAGR